MKVTHLLSLVPFIGMVFALPLVDRVEPYVLGMPFNLFWVVLWVVLTSAIIGLIYFIDPANRGGEAE
ncbi:DUF3311 domain-containing protein [Brevibacillus fluminis]|uniref:DUF3311 domain-containing protein n=1 Tax=Brevibacillus fluminis TaxID=511487 RepID=UPI003F896308